MAINTTRAAWAASPTACHSPPATWSSGDSNTDLSQSHQLVQQPAQSKAAPVHRPVQYMPISQPDHSQVLPATLPVHSKPVQIDVHQPAIHGQPAPSQSVPRLDRRDSRCTVSTSHPHYYLRKQMSKTSRNCTQVSQPQSMQNMCPSQGALLPCQSSPATWSNRDN